MSDNTSSTKAWVIIAILVLIFNQCSDESKIKNMKDQIGDLEIKIHRLEIK